MSVRRSRSTLVDRWWARAEERPVHVRTPEERTTAYFNEHAPPITRALAAAFPAHQRQDIEDAVQEAFLRLYTVLIRGEEVEHPGAWAFTVAKNQVLGSIRKAKFQHRVYNQVSEFIATQMTSSGASMTPEHLFLDRSRWQALEESWCSLSEFERWCLRERAAGRTFAEMGRVANLDLRRVSELTARAVQRLHGKLCG